MGKYIPVLLTAVMISCSGGDSSPTYTVTYNTNGGSGYQPVDSNQYFSGSKATVLERSNTDGSQVLTQSGQTFAGWESGGAVYPAGSSITIGGNVTLNARWEAETAGMSVAGGVLSTAGIPGGTATLVLPDDTVTIPDNLFSSDPEIGNITALVIPEGVETIGISAFEGATNLQTVYISEGVTSIGDAAFKNASSLEEIIIPPGINTISESAFENAMSLTTLVLPDSVTTIEDYAFEDTSSLTVLDLPDSLISIGAGAFEGASSLTDIEIPEGVTTIGATAFKNNTSVQTITLPSTMVDLGDDMFFPGETFSGAVSLTTITFHPSTDPSFTTIHPGTFQGAGLLTTINNLPDTVTEISDFAFDQTASLTSFDFPSGLQIIGFRGFRGSGLTSITIPSGVTSIGADGFRDNTDLATVDFSALTGTDTTTIGSRSFDNTKLMSVTLPEAVGDIKYLAFGNIPTLTTVRVERITAPLTDNGSMSALEVFDDPVATLELPPGYDSASYTDADSNATWDNFISTGTY